MFYIFNFLPSSNKQTLEEFIYISNYYQKFLFHIVEFVPRVFQCFLLLKEESAKQDLIKPTFGVASLPESQVSR